MAQHLIGTRIAAIYELQAEWLEPRLADLGVSWATFQLLTTVTGAGDEASQIEVARRLGVTAATLSESVQGHVERGLLKQSRSKSDKRVKLLSLTAKSRRTMQRIRELLTESEAALSRGLLPHELSATATVLDRVRRNLEPQR
ncbi:MAG: MarR family transcriptional regulator [Armatimonadetes bacterium]|nr:MarR family transcriptional regulator [Armatimonadota bacterium]